MVDPDGPLALSLRRATELALLREYVRVHVQMTAMKFWVQQEDIG